MLNLLYNFHAWLSGWAYILEQSDAWTLNILEWICKIAMAIIEFMT